MEMHQHHVTLQGPSDTFTEEPIRIIQHQLWVQPRDIVHQLNNFWQPIWQRDPATNASDTSDLPPAEHISALLESLPPMEHIPVDMLDFPEWKQAVKHLKPGSARGIDMVSATELQLLPEQLIDHLAKTMALYTQGFPEWYMGGVTCPFSKALTSPRAGETRPITVLPQTYRLWASVAYRQIVRHLSRWVPPQVTGLLPGRGSTQAAFRAQLAIELNKFASTPIGGLVLDLTKCFNNIGWAFGIALLRSSGIPEPLLQQWSRSLRKLKRVWAVAKHISDPIAVTTGYPEGDTWSVLVMIMLACCWTTHLKARSTTQEQKTDVSAYADNWGWHSSHMANHHTFLQATLELTAAAGVSLDPKKTWCWATNPTLARAIQQNLADLLDGQLIPILPAAKDLGWQMQYGNTPLLGSITARIEEGEARLQRLGGLPYSLDVKEKLLLTSVYPAMFHGCENRPIAQDTIKHTRSKVATALFGRTPSMSPSIALLFCSNANLDPEFWLIQQIISTTRRYLIQVDPSAKASFLLRASQLHGTLQQVTGPASCFSYAILLVGWSVSPQGLIHVSAFESFCIFEVSMQRLQRFLQQSWQEGLIRAKTDRTHWFAHPDLDRSLTVPILQKFTPAERVLLIREIAGGYQLASQQAKWNHNKTDQCQWCEAPDSRPHRLLHCPIGQHAREPFKELVTALEEEDSPLIEIPAMIVQPYQHLYQTLQFQIPVFEIPVEAVAHADQILLSTGDLHWFTDGSCHIRAHPAPDTLDSPWSWTSAPATPKGARKCTESTPQGRRPQLCR